MELCAPEAELIQQIMGYPCLLSANILFCSVDHWEISGCFLGLSTACTGFSISLASIKLIFHLHWVSLDRYNHLG